MSGWQLGATHLMRGSLKKRSGMCSPSKRLSLRTFSTSASSTCAHVQTGGHTSWRLASCTGLPSVGHSGSYYNTSHPSNATKVALHSGEHPYMHPRGAGLQRSMRPFH